MLDISKINDQAREVFDELVRLRPEWEPLTSNYQYLREPNDEPIPSDYGFIVSIPCPFPNNPPIVIEVLTIDLVWVTFGTPFEEFEMNYPFFEKSFWAQLWPTDVGRSANYITKEIIRYVDELMQEKLISAEWRRRKRSGWQCGLISEDTWKDFVRRVFFIRSVSWNGKFNRSFDGKWEWGT